MTGLQAFFMAKCPQCRKGDIFKGSMFSLNFKSVHTHCSHCKVKFESEPGFFWGAMYFSYGLMVGTIILSGTAMFIIYDEPPVIKTGIIIISIAMVLIPFYLRLSRLMLIYLASPYKNFRPDL